MYQAGDNRPFVNELRPQRINSTFHKGKIAVDSCLKFVRIFRDLNSQILLRFVAWF